MQLPSAQLITCDNQLRVEQAGVFLQLVVVDVASLRVHLWSVMETAGSHCSLQPALLPKLAPAVKDKMTFSTCPQLLAPLCHENQEGVPGQDLRERWPTKYSAHANGTDHQVWLCIHGDALRSRGKLGSPAMRRNQRPLQNERSDTHAPQRAGAETVPFRNDTQCLSAPFLTQVQ